jgi:hypothetical protein
MSNITKIVRIASRQQLRKDYVKPIGNTIFDSNCQKNQQSQNISSFRKNNERKSQSQNHHFINIDKYYYTQKTCIDNVIESDQDVDQMYYCNQGDVADLMRTYRNF